MPEAVHFVPEVQTPQHVWYLHVLRTRNLISIQLLLGDVLFGNKGYGFKDLAGTKT